jgi:hypothetical protein
MFGTAAAVTPVRRMQREGRAPRAQLAVAIGAAGMLFASAAAADEPFVDRPLTLPPLHLSADAGLGFGQYPAESPESSLVATDKGMKLGFGSSLEAAIGLPYIGEIGARVGIRFGDSGIAAGWGLGADHFARLFDPVLDEPGGSMVTNPEFRVRGTILSTEIIELALEMRVIVPTSANSDLELSPGVPVRIHLPGFMRIDTGAWLPIEFNDSTSYSIDIPAQLYFQASDAFFGPMAGFRYNHPGGGSDSSTDIPAGIGGGYTLDGMLDLKVQVRTERINDRDWTRYIGGGVGVGLRLP